MDYTYPIFAGVVVIVLLIAFEITYRDGLARTASGLGARRSYQYYIDSERMVEIRSLPGRRYRIYVPSGRSPLPLREDRFGSYFTLSGASPREIEEQIDNLFEKETP